MKVTKSGLGVVLVLATLTLTNLGSVSAKIAQGNKKPGRALKRSGWQAQLQAEIKALEKLHPNRIGLYVKDLNSGEEYSHHADENWYLASTVKVPIAMEVLRQVDAKTISLDDQVEIKEEDFVDGNGPLITMEVGTKVSIRFLIEQMIIWSDNMASDMLLRIVGLDKVNKLVNDIAPDAFGPITTLKDVRKHLYSEVHEKAFDLEGRSFMELKKIRDPNQKIIRLATLLQLDHKKQKLQGMHTAYQAYYQKGLNSASPRSYAKVLEDLWNGKRLSASSREFLIKTMLKTQTGKNRIRAGLKSPLVFAHKTGTQYQRIADVGFLWDPNKPHRKPLLLIAFVRDVKKPKTAAKLMEKVAKTINETGVL